MPIKIWEGKEEIQVKATGRGGVAGEASVVDFPAHTVFENVPANAGDTGLIFGWGTKIPHAPSS